MREKNNLWRRIILAAVLLGLILAGFFVYLSSNRWRTLERNANYIADAATQSAKRIDDLLISAENTTGPRMPEYLTQRLVEEGGDSWRLPRITSSCDKTPAGR